MILEESTTYLTCWGCGSLVLMAIGESLNQTEEEHKKVCPRNN